MKNKYILAIDQGTTGSRAIIFNAYGKVVASSYREFKQYFPKPGWVEHDAQEIWQSCVTVIREVIASAKISSVSIAGIGITNQRETTVLWDRKTSKPVTRAIVWQCRRTSEICHRLKRKEEVVRAKTGLVIDPYFSATKIKWCLDNVAVVRQKAKSGDLCFGTIDCWLIWKLTGGHHHVTDMTNASRTLLFDIHQKKWDKDLLKIFGVPAAILPKVQNSGSIFGHTNGLKILPSGIPISGVLGDQQAALYGQGCFEAGTIKNTYGTGCFIVLNTGKKAIISKKGLLTTLAADFKGNPVFAMEGSIFMAGAVVQWLRDQLKIIPDSKSVEKIIRGLKDTQGVFFVPAFAGLGAPHWDSEARGLICGLTRGAEDRHIVRAALESIAYQVKDVYSMMQKESGKRISQLKVDGGASQNNFLMQFQSDILSCQIIRPKNVETTAQGAAFLAGVTVGLWKTKSQLKTLMVTEKRFSPKMSSSKRDELFRQWQTAVSRARSIHAK